MKSAAIYARFSTELQNEKSTEDQIALCRTYAARHQLNIVAIFEDKARSGASVFGRDGLMQLMDAARQNLFTVVIVEALDRLSRDMEDLAGGQQPGRVSLAEYCQGAFGQKAVQSVVEP